MTNIAHIRLRLAQPSDAQAIAALHADSWRTAYRGMLPDEFLDNDVVDDRATLWAKRFGDAEYLSHTVTLLAEQNGELAGFAHSFIDEDPEWGTLLDNLHVRPELKRSGIGTKLVVESAARVQALGSELGLYLWVLEGNANAQRFYDALGGRVVGRSTSPEGGGSAPSLRYWWPQLELLPEVR
ncbi:MAG: GNAT family N-acetyltransferase, partial [Dehalococcoidia bacterium]